MESCSCGAKLGPTTTPGRDRRCRPEKSGAAQQAKNGQTGTVLASLQRCLAAPLWGGVMVWIALADRRSARFSKISLGAQAGRAATAALPDAAPMLRGSIVAEGQVPTGDRS